jgi:hypothetical protein
MLSTKTVLVYRSAGLQERLPSSPPAGAGKKVTRTAVPPDDRQSAV